MTAFWDNIDGEGRTLLAGVMSVCAVFVVGIICLTVHCTVTEVNNPNPHKWDKTTPTVKARLVPVEDK